MKPDYQKIYQDMLKYRFIEQSQVLSDRLESRALTSIDVIQLNNRLFYTQKNKSQHKAYDLQSILKILKYQQTHQLNNTELAKHFGISRSTVTKWKLTYKF